MEFPDPPEGFVWKLYKNAIFLKPEGWTEQEMKGTTADIPYATYATSPEEFSVAKQFEMGMTLQFFSDFKRIQGIEATEMVLAYLRPFVKDRKKEDLILFKQEQQGDLEQTFFRYRDAPPGLQPIIVHKFIVANSVTNIVNVFTFESPEESWAENWVKYGTPIIGQLNLLSDVPSD